MLKLFIVLMLCVNHFLYAEDYLPENAFWKYKYENQDHNGNIVHKGSVVFTVKNIDNTFYELVSFDETGEINSNKFDTKNKIFSGNILYDIVNEQNRQVFLQFSPYLIANKSRSVVLDSKFPKTSFPVYSYHNHISWSYSAEIIGNEIIQVHGKNIDAVKVILSGQRPTGPGGCMQGQPGIIKIESWFGKETSRFVKQIVNQFHCSIDTGKILSRETYELISSSDLSKEEINIQTPIQNPKQKLIELKNLFDKGLITKEIYIEKQRKILNGSH
ncbi:SHOCT domain-containing protein [Candidatus Methylopumilus universalis]|jgi:hypothetical protein|uniref:SHOCT domain-containing protein n=1 Tax=Candidatus Methylopumilus universalis TaxID=2588536 RepID=UPI0011215336|nr:SHOCT domain-containing protein [Candidatus Methylopumilus universalis]QDC80697.1 SHOCT domain-containing protein [Candidatus Methylopumilus universalis]QDC82006.1 SHOCT domain-containing protein [Candidatus Methylopumilus universalis]QDC88440.1 SHOCT domain-containing protein [Candidatus Methylopumilus universalis]